MNRRLATTENRLKRGLQQLRSISFARLKRPETWRPILQKVRWSVSLKRRRIRRLVRQLAPLDRAAPPRVQALRDEVFAQTCLELKRLEERRKLVQLLNTANQPVGAEQIFLSAIYPQILRRNLGISPVPTTMKHRLDVEIGYLGHNEDYFFWVFELDSATEDGRDQPLTPTQAIRQDKRYVIYRLGLAGLSREPHDATQAIIDAQILFNHILTDLRKRNYKVTAASIPHFEQERLSLLRRLALGELRKRRARS